MQLGLSLGEDHGVIFNHGSLKLEFSDNYCDP